MPALRVYFALGSASFFVASATVAGCAVDYETLAEEKGLAVDDGNPCTADKLVNGATTHDPTVREDLALTVGGNVGVCKSGKFVPNCEDATCVCSTDADCPNSTDCSTWSCDVANGICQETLVAQGTPIPTQMVGNCNKEVCDGQGGIAAEPDDMDVAPSDNPCMTNHCADGKSGPPTSEPVGTSCGNNLVCNGKGECSDCLSKMEKAACPGCSAKLCAGEACGADGDCSTAHCADGVCCKSDCTGECMSCGIAGSLGTCTNVPYYQEDASYTDPVFMSPNVACETDFKCNGNGKCLKIIGIGCAKNTDCISDNCAMPAKVCLGAAGESCFNPSQCASGTCKAGFCE